ncbi:hypothetical protein F0U60_53270 [Archangium minus]|uniref:Transposase n=1 Tax=Archangium minus TaxID=83450 RepID=A0ABY9X965_9BACT|nr:hypothetical protein F0U60_53270 [Archangium minus]
MESVLPLKHRCPGEVSPALSPECRRRVLAYVKGAGGVRAILEHLGLPTIWSDKNSFGPLRRSTPPC